VFAGGFGLEAAEAVCASADLDKDDVVDVLSRLVDKSLVNSGDRSGGRTRYRILETIREYATERLTQAGEFGIRRRHAEHYRRLPRRGKVHCAAEGNPSGCGAWTRSSTISGPRSRGPRKKIRDSGCTSPPTSSATGSLAAW
jgi:predicted ATPase